MLLDKHDNLLAFIVQEIPEDCAPLFHIMKKVFGDSMRHRDTTSGNDQFEAIHFVEYNRYFTDVCCDLIDV
jgi:hypothetical protein